MNITIKNLQKKLSLNPSRIKRAVRNALIFEGAKVSGEITLCFVTDNEIKKINAKYLKHKYPTDVISFDISIDKRKLLADIIVSTDTAIKNAGLYKTTPLQETILYVIHGLLHVLGYNDLTPKQIAAMRKKELIYAHL